MPEQLEIQLGAAWAGVEFRLKTDSGTYPGTIPVGDDGVLRLEIGGSSSYQLTCIGSAAPAPTPEPTTEVQPSPAPTDTPSATSPLILESEVSSQPQATITVSEVEPVDPEFTFQDIPVWQLGLFGGGKFAPNRNVTREQMAVILYNYARYTGCDLMSRDGALVRFSDYGKISGYAWHPMEWAVTHSLLAGSGGKLNPQGTATRAQVAQVFKNAHDLLAASGVLDQPTPVPTAAPIPDAPRIDINDEVRAKLKEVKAALNLPSSKKFSRSLCYEGAGWAAAIGVVWGSERNCGEDRVLSLQYAPIHHGILPHGTPAGRVLLALRRGIKNLQPLAYPPKSVV